MKNWMKLLLKATICSIVILPMITSCYDDKSLWDKLNKIENRLDSLELSLNKQLSALNSLIDGKTTVSSCDKNSDGSYDITLSNGTTFTVLAEGSNYSALVSVKEVGGVKCWATYDASGEMVVLKDAAGNPIPVIKEEYRPSIEVVVEDGIYYLVVDGKKYMTGYDTKEMVQVFSSCTPLKDASGNIYAMTFTFGEGVSITVAVDGYNGVIFRLPNAAGTVSALSEYFINFGTTESMLLNMTGVIDYVMQVPDGWRVAERTDETTGEIFLDITAPAASTVEAGAAVAEGDLKVVAVVEGGKAAITKLAISAVPFKVFNISAINAEITPYNGVQKFAYGVSLSNDFNEESLLAEINDALYATGDIPAGINITDSKINSTLSAIYGAELDTETAYVFWAIPALYSEDKGYFVKKGMFQTFRVAPIKVEFDTPVTSLLDAEINMEIDGTSSMYAGTALKSDDLFENIVYQINNEIIEPMNAVNYSGPASGFPTEDSNSIEFTPDTEYVVWVVPVEDDKSTYTTNDIIFKEFKTNSIISGGTLQTTLGAPTVDKTSISIPMSSEGAELIYYAYLSKTEGDRYSGLDNDDKAELLFEHSTCKSVRSSEAAGEISRVKPNTTMWLYALAVDRDGKYGTVNTKSATTDAVQYNSLSVTVDTPEIGATKATFKITVSGGTASELIYWVGKTTDAFWANSSYLGASANTAQEYMACYPDDENIRRAMNSYGEIAEDGTLVVDELNINTQYALMVLAKDENGLYSKGGFKQILTMAADLGNIVVTDSEQWKAVKQQVEIKWNENAFIKGSVFSTYEFEIKCPKNLTAFINCSSHVYYDNPNYFATVEDKMIDIEAVTSRSYDLPIVTYDSNGVLADEPDWTNDKGEVKSGNMMNVYEPHVHGVPSRGFVAYLAEGSHGKDNCTSWENNECANYARAKKKIEEKCDLEYWKQKFRDRGVTNETYITQNAQAYLNAYKPHYEGKEPKIFINDGSALTVTQASGIGPDDNNVVTDDVIIVFKDLEGNYYEPMYFAVPNYFKSAN